jgi:uncharacterized protein YbjT (DUF2867 family)
MILVVGRRSKIGSALVGKLVARGQKVRALVRAAEGAGSFADGVECVLGDLAELDSLRSAVAGVDRVFCFAGRASRSYS